MLCLEEEKNKSQYLPVTIMQYTNIKAKYHVWHANFHVCVSVF